MAYAKIDNGLVRIYQALPQNYTFSDGGNTGNFSDMPDSLHITEGFLPFEDNPPPHDPQLFILEQDGYEVMEELVRQKYKLTPIPEEVLTARQAEEEAAAWLQVQEKCKQLLAETDRKWDAPNKEEYTTCRHQLRDIYHNRTNPAAIIWPEKPAQGAVS